jgi:glycosyltransferase involved in cell wall biosynthesis
MLTEEARRAIGQLKQADIVIGIPSYNNARTIGHVVRAAQAGLAKYFPQLSSVIINSDGGSRDGTQEAVLKASIEDPHLLLLCTPLLPVHRLSLPYHGIPGKGSAFRMIFAMARELGARPAPWWTADLRSITPEWVDSAGATRAPCRLRFRRAVLSPAQIRRHHHQQHRLSADPRPLRPARAPAHRRRLRHSPGVC